MESEARLSSCAGQRHDQLSPDLLAPPRWRAIDSAVPCIPVPLLFFYPVRKVPAPIFGTGESMKPSLARQGHRRWRCDYRTVVLSSHQLGRGNPASVCASSTTPRSAAWAIKLPQCRCGMRPPVPPNGAGVHQRDTAEGLTPTNRATARQPPNRTTTDIAGCASCFVLLIAYLKKNQHLQIQ